MPRATTPSSCARPSPLAPTRSSSTWRTPSRPSTRPTRGPWGTSLAEQPAWVRVNAARTRDCGSDLAAVADLALGFKIPKTEPPEDVTWVAERAPGKRLICAIETARGVLAAHEIAAVPGVHHLAMGGVDLERDLAVGNGNLHTLYVRSHLVVASRAAGIQPPVDNVYPHLNDEAGLREQAEFARALGFLGKSAIHPR